ncbi:MAG TPA: D-alanyl-D-alanine carboxypeptidase family protein [Devosia sp.]|nr:D-alanyl-D-alanine carboxypeptidase family protein [Devosia sp.]
MCSFLFASSVLPASAIPMLLVDAKTLQVLYAEDAGQPWHPASVTKLMTAYLAFAAIKDGRVSLDTPVTISQHAWNQAPAKSGLEVGEAVSLKDALYIMLVKSANDMAVAIAETIGGTEKAFVEQMNLMARQMGMTGTHYDNANGLKSPGQVTTARDLAIIALYIQRDYPQYMPIFQTQNVQLGTHRLETSNTMLEHFSGLTGMKTGYICQSGLNIVATADRDGRSLVAVVLGASSARERNELAAQLILRGLSGAASPTGQTVLDLKDIDADPVDMSPLICGKKAKAYIRQRMADFPMGLKGQPSYLTDKVEGPTYVATELGKVVSDVPMPRPRPQPDIVPRIAAN